MSRNTPDGPRRYRRLQPNHADPYQTEAKTADSLVCDDCNVVQHGGRWYWGAPPLGDEHGGLCPACRRVRDRAPAGTIRLPAAMAEHAAELTHLLRRIEQAEKSEHPLERIMAIEVGDGGMSVTTTGVHIARRITRQLERRFHQKARVRYDETRTLHVDWSA